MKILVNSLCKQGGRDYNQDYVAYDASDGDACLVVCDGLGSYIGSEVASRLCATKIVETYKHVKETEGARAFTPDIVKAYVQTAHNYVAGYKEQNPVLRSSCTTVAGVVTNLTDTVIVHIGDTRAYILREGKIVYQTRDHSLARAAVDLGEIPLSEIRNHKDQNKLTRVLGSGYYIAPDCEIVTVPLQVGDGIIICSDGFWEYVYDEEMEADFVKASTPSEYIALMEARLLARVGPHNDNYSVIAAMVVE